MNTEELAFVNRQLAGMLKAGIPLEAGLKKITESMSDSKLKAQLDELGDRLEKGQSVEQAADGLDLPETYKRLLALGQDGQNMPKVLTCVADYYERVGTLATRLKGLAIYPMMILVCGLLVTGLMAYLSSILRADLIDISQGGPTFSEVYQSGALSFEIISNGNKLVSNCGYHKKDNSKLNGLSKSSAAQSTLIIDDNSSCKFINVNKLSLIHI